MILLYCLFLIVCVLAIFVKPFESLPKQKSQRDRALEWQAEQNKKWREKKQRKQRQSAISRIETREKQEREAEKRAAHEQRTLANKKRKEQARMEYSLRTWGVPYMEPFQIEPK
jgi:predicted Holliday junction resolvase-like endonuclease